MVIGVFVKEMSGGDTCLLISMSLCHQFFMHMNAMWHVDDGEWWD